MTYEELLRYDGGCLLYVLLQGYRRSQEQNGGPCRSRRGRRGDISAAGGVMARRLLAGVGVVRARPNKATVVDHDSASYMNRMSLRERIGTRRFVEIV